ncbi:MAG: PTS galactitol transporter subunit IIB [Bacillaceae bacterium]|uniref:PTS sugar transporter subunit IIB n=1 Tax=Aeribacillus composti TaxID=1868734 RepID=A0ABY9WBV0_9BACI|nr:MULTISPECIES: PTS sugar transporter subunit IIB [Aeribacillus]REJ18367.1 MAG: PTS galactitol transporter subunit IIB [Bacillaceae bacterium]KZM57632.1 PTS galactitol transporter subunit IIB [Aeribacillus pallidus]MED0651809.1 PTS sugar transporter subunit IIB [Aeribacillus composti]MED0702929.1 PTS sugar transporter subunit IIB [Aeribacillus composti]MED0716527.1 PTS sugar transporter subunit IIB [Aeribacillus composti]
MAQKKILVCCGTAVATSTVVAKKIEEVLKNKGFNVAVEQCKAAEVPVKAENADVIVTTTPVSNVGDVPVIQTVSFLTGVGIDDDINKIIEYLNK